MKRANVVLILAMVAGCVSHETYTMLKKGGKAKPIQEEFFMALLPPASVLSWPNYDEEQAAYWREHGVQKFKWATELLKKGARVNARYANGMTALIRLQMMPALSIDPTKFLVEHGADVNAKDEFGNTALDYVMLRAAWNAGEKEDYLIKHGARPINFDTVNDAGIDNSFKVESRLLNQLKRLDK